MTAERIMIHDHYTTLLLILLCGMKLYSQKRTRDAELRYFWMTLIACFLLVIQDILETISATSPDFRFWRTLLSVVGYTLRPVAALGLLLVVCSPKHRTIKMWIPALINMAVNLTAFFSPVAFYFDENYAFTRGPLGYVVFIVSFLYMVQTFIAMLRHFYGGNRIERWILACCVIGAMVAAVIDATMGGRHLNEAIMIGSIFMLFFLRTHDNYLDPLTSLRNRFAYYNDSASMHRSVTAVASIDMNGLKKLNDTRGHAAGDAALVRIGKCLAQINDRSTISYRVGGDEFVVLFLGQAEEAVEHTLHKLRENVALAGCSISAGYAMKARDESLDEALRISDQNMYREKAEYHQRNG